MCKFNENVKKMTYENCNLFKRSFSTGGLGYTFNGEMNENSIKKEFQSKLFLTKMKLLFMKSTKLQHSLNLVNEHNAEEVVSYQNRGLRPRKKPREILISLHNPKEPGDTQFILSTSTQIPLGQSTTFLITLKASIIDDSGKELTESQRGCRLDDDTDALDIYNVYTRISCLLECKMLYAITKCGCTPWDYPVNMNRKVS